MPTTLLCYKCNKYKRYSAFYKNISTSSGCSFPCKECKTKYDKNYTRSQMKHEDFKPIRMGNKIDSSKLTTWIKRDIYKDEKGFFYRNKSNIKCVNIFKCKLCKLKTANADQKDTCSACTQTYRAGFRRDQGGPFVFTPNNGQIIVSKLGEDGNKIYRSIGSKWRKDLYKHGCNKCNIESLYQRTKTPKRCHYCWDLQQKRSPMAEIIGGKPKKGNTCVTWTKDKVLSALNKLEPSQRKWTYLEKNGGIPLYHAAKRCFETWENALLALNQEETDPQLASFLLLTEGDWKKANLLYDISTKIPLHRRTYGRMMEDGTMRFYYRAGSYFGNWQNTLSLLSKQNQDKLPDVPEVKELPVPKKETTTSQMHTNKDDLDINTHISERDARHEPYCNMLKEVAQRIGREAQGSILSLCGISPLIDKTRIQTWFYGSDTYIWYEIKQNVYDKIKDKAKSLNKIFGGFVNHEIHFGDILESRHENVALLNLDLEGPGSIMTEKLMNQVESMVLSALTKRKRTGLILNTHTRGPKGMTCCKRIALWYTMLSNVESKGYRVVKPIEPVSYCNTAGSQMQLYAVAFEKTK